MTDPVANVPKAAGDTGLDEYRRLREGFIDALANVRCDCGGEAVCMEHGWEAEDAMDRLLTIVLLYPERAGVEHGFVASILTPESVSHCLKLGESWTLEATILSNADPAAT